MSGSLGSLNIKLSLDAVEFLQRLAKSEQAAIKFSRQTQKQLDDIKSGVDKLGKATDLAGKLAKLNILGISLKNVGVQAYHAAESYTALKNKIALVTDTQQKQATAMAVIFDISQRTNQAMGATSDVYARFASNADRLGLSQRQVASLTETVSKAVAMSGASADEAQRGLTQFGQALATGSLKGQDLNSIMQQIPGLADAIAKGLGVTTGELKELGAKGELSIQKVIGALQKVRTQVDNDFDNRLKTISGSFNNLQNAFTKFVGETDQAYGVTQKLAEGIEFVADNLEEVIQYAGLFIAALSLGHLSNYSVGLLKVGYASAQNVLHHKQEAQAVYAKIVAMKQSAAARIVKLQQLATQVTTEKELLRIQREIATQTALVTNLTNAEATAKRNVAQANTLAATAAKGLQSVMGLLGGPVGVITIAASALWYFSDQADQARQKALNIAGANEQLKESYEGLSEAILTAKIYEHIEAMQEQEKQLQKLGTAMIQAEFSHRRGGWFASSAQEVDKATSAYRAAVEVAQTKSEVFNNLLRSIAKSMLDKGKSVDDVRNKLLLFNISQEKATLLIEQAQESLKGNTAETQKNETAVLDLVEAQKKLNEKSQTMKQRLEVLTLKSQGNAKASFVLAGLYEVLGTEGAKYADVLHAIATGQTVSAESAKNLSAEMLNQLKTMATQLESVFADSEQVQTIEQNFKTKSTGKSQKELRKEWESYYNEL